MVGVSGFEPEASWTRTKRDTKLRHTPIAKILYGKIARLSSIIPRMHAFIKCIGCRMNRGDYMSYEIRYHMNMCKKLPLRSKRITSFRFIKWTILLGALVLGAYLRSNDYWRKFWIPGDPAVTSHAVETFADNLKEGISLDTAFRTFYWEIVGDD